MLPRRLGVRFALEALFLVLLALGAGLAHLRTLYIVIVMAVAWLLVALAEMTAERIDRSPFSYLAPRSAWDEDDAPSRVFGPRVEERTVVAPPEDRPVEEDSEQLTVLEPAPKAEPEPQPAPAAEEPAAAEAEPSLEPSLGERLRSRLRRREPAPEPPEPAAPRHVKLLPRRAAPEPSRAAREVAELFGSSPEGEGEEKPKETGT